MPSPFFTGADMMAGISKEVGGTTRENHEGDEK